MKKISISLSVILACMFTVFFYFSGASDKSRLTLKADAQSQFAFAPYLEDILKNYREDWTRLTESELSGLHWKQNITVYINKDEDIYLHNYTNYRKQLDYDEDEDEDEENKITFRKYNPGTVIVKENYRISDGSFTKPDSVTVLIKQEPGYDPTMGDWRFVQLDTAGNIIVDGSSQDPAVNIVCAFCHRAMVERDFVFSTVYTSPEDEK